MRRGYMHAFKERLPHHVTLSVLTSNSKVYFLSFFLLKQITEKKEELTITRKQNTDGGLGNPTI